MLAMACALMLSLGSLSPMRGGSSAGQSAFMSAAASASKVAVVVEVEIEPSRIDDFLAVIEEDAVGSRERENGGCLQFDVLRDRERLNVFRFFELYRDSAALALHKETPHFAKWREFKASGGVLSQVSSVNDAVFVA